MNLATNSSFSQINVEIISATNETFGTYGSSIVNSLGQQVLLQKYSVNTRRHQQTISIGNLARGIYYIKIFGKNGEKIKAAAFMKM